MLNWIWHHISKFLYGDILVAKENDRQKSIFDEAIAEHPALKEMYEEANADRKEFFKTLNIKIRNFDLVSEALAAMPVENSHILRFNELIEHDFKDFCTVEPALNDVIPTLKLLHIKDEMQRIAYCPKLNSRRIGAVGGGFSSGKSAFINSFLSSSKIRLAEGILPVTAIPSYIIADNSDETTIQGVNYKGGLFDISSDVYKDLSHEMLKSFKFNLKDVIRYITVIAPMPENLFGNICLMDTPGYNPPKAGTQKDDWAIARQYINEAEFLVWLVGLDSNGTIPKSDIDFLASMDFGKESGKSLYVVANKAELKPGSDLETILDNFEECLEDADLVVDGICAYSSKDEKKIYSTRGRDIFKFLEEQNNPSRLYENFMRELYEIFEKYTTMICNDIKENNDVRNSIKKLQLDAFEGGFTGIEASSNIENGLNNLINKFSLSETKEKRIDRVNILRDNFRDCIINFCKDACIEINDNDIGNSKSKPLDRVEANKETNTHLYTTGFWIWKKTYIEKPGYDAEELKTYIDKKCQIIECIFASDNTFYGSFRDKSGKSIIMASADLNLWIKLLTIENHFGVINEIYVFDEEIICRSNNILYVGNRFGELYKNKIELPTFYHGYRINYNVNDKKILFKLNKLYFIVLKYNINDFIIYNGSDLNNLHFCFDSTLYRNSRDNRWSFDLNSYCVFNNKFNIVMFNEKYTRLGKIQFNNDTTFDIIYYKNIKERLTDIISLNDNLYINNGGNIYIANADIATYIPENLSYLDIRNFRNITVDNNNKIAFLLNNDSIVLTKDFMDFKEIPIKSTKSYDFAITDDTICLYNRNGSKSASDMPYNKILYKTY